jgi:hypothetical protein
VFAYSNGRGPDRSLVVYHNRFATVAGWIRDAVSFAVKAGDGSKSTGRATLAEALGAAADDAAYFAFREARAGLEYLRPSREIVERGLFVELDAYRSLVFGGFRELRSSAEAPWAELAAQLRGRGVASLEDELADLRLRPVHDRVAPAVVPGVPAATAVALAAAVDDLDRRRFDELRLATPLRRAGFADAAVRATRLALGLPHPATTPDAAALAKAWLADDDVRSFLEVHDWEDASYLNGDRWTELVELAAALDRVAGARRTSPAIGRLRSAAEQAGYRVDRIVEVVHPADRPKRAAKPSPKTSTRSPRR